MGADRSLSRAYDIYLDEDDQGIFVDLGGLGVVEGPNVVDVLREVANKIEAKERLINATSDR